MSAVSSFIIIFRFPSTVITQWLRLGISLSNMIIPEINREPLPTNAMFHHSLHKGSASSENFNALPVISFDYYTTASNNDSYYFNQLNFFQ